MLNTRRFRETDLMVRTSDRPSWEYIYKISTVRDVRWNIGDTVELADGREFTFAKSDGLCKAGQAVEFTTTGYQAITALGAATAIGSNQVTVAAGPHVAVATDELAGGYMIIYPSGSTNDTVQFRGIIGNDVSAANAATTLYLDGGLILAVSSADTAEVFANPFAAVHLAATTTLAKAGVPASYVPATGYYFWVQTKGFVWVAPQSSLATNKIGACWRHDGTVASAEEGMDAAAGNYALVSTQYAGFTVTGNYGTNGPLFKLMS